MMTSGQIQKYVLSWSAPRTANHLPDPVRSLNKSNTAASVTQTGKITRAPFNASRKGPIVLRFFIPTKEKQGQISQSNTLKPESKEDVNSGTRSWRVQLGQNWKTLQSVCHKESRQYYKNHIHTPMSALKKEPKHPHTFQSDVKD